MGIVQNHKYYEEMLQTRVVDYIYRVSFEGFLKFQMFPNEFDVYIFHTKESEKSR